MSKHPLPSESEGGGFLKRVMTPTRSDQPSRPSTPSQVWKNAAKRLQPVLRAVVAFATNREFEKRPSQYRLQVAQKQHGAVTLTPLFVGISAAFADEPNVAVVAIALHDSVYLHDFTVHNVPLPANHGDSDPIADFVIASLQKYQKKNLCKYIGGGLPVDLERLCPSLCSRLWSELDLVPLALWPDQEGSQKEMEDFTFWKDRGVDEQADSMARKSITAFGPSLSPLLQVGYRGIVQIDAGFRAHMHILEDYQKTCQPVTWDAMLHYAAKLKEKKTKIAFFSSTPQGGGVALMRHALVRFARTVEVDLRWYVPKPKPGVFRITKTIHNILQGVADHDLRISDVEKASVDGWITEHAERYWLCKKGPLQPPSEGGADIIIIDDPQMPSLIPLIKIITPNRPVLYRSHIQIRSDLCDTPGTPQQDIWDHLWSKIMQADMFISHPIPEFIPKNVPAEKVVYLPATTDWLDGLNKPLADWDTQYYMHLYNQRAHGIRMAELGFPDRQYFIQVARFDPSKGIPVVLKAYVEFRALLFKKVGISSSKNAPQLLIVGNGSIDDPDGTLIHDQTMSYIDTYCPHLASSISVQRLEPNDQLLNTLLTNAHVVMQLSIREGFEVKVSEALKKGRPVIASRVGGIQLQVQHERNGFLVEPGDWKDAAGYLLRLWTDHELHDRMSEVAARTVSDEVGTVGNALAWFYLASKFQEGGVEGAGRGVKFEVGGDVAERVEEIMEQGNPGICETTPGVKSYSGYVHLPPGLLSDISGENQDYPINTFFWFFESRKDPKNAPLAIWLNGGPGGSSLMGGLQENGPCFIGSDSNSTYLNPWSWNNEVNMLYLDQPAQVGFSYDVLTNITVDLAQEGELKKMIPTDFTDGVPEQNNTFYVGTGGSQSLGKTANTTVHAAHALWHFAQTWFAEFPAYKPNDDRVSLWTESYGGHYGPGFFKFFQQQNEKINNGTIDEEGTHYIHLDTLGIVNGLLDNLIQSPSYYQMAYNNTYGIQHISKEQYERSIYEYERPGGCREKLAACQKLAEAEDPDWRGNVPSVIKCFDGIYKVDCASMETVESMLTWGWYDIAHPKADPTPEPYMHGYLAQDWVLSALGVPVNFTTSSPTVAYSFDSTGDINRAGSMQAVAYLLDSGVKVHMMYGDRDFACNWLGGEAVSELIEYEGAKGFKSAGYAPIVTSEGEGGFVRQYGNYSFSRVFQAGHEVPWYQPEVSYEIFMRAMFNRDIATGLLPVSDDLTTTGLSSTFHIKNEVPEYPEPKCYVRAPGTCTPEQYATVIDGTAIVKDFFVVGNVKDEIRGDGAQKVLMSPERVDEL
ncbi:hypothetical protein V491_08278 [Pseudogymnoascus sp. VKM F-3775]|nr:hypothetical protein V491_08278 [Pseudogymnoascus sp. VKM F-3775]